MGRIRSIKPDFFKHEDLYKAEKESELPLRVAFSGLWTVADREGRFKWKPNTIKLDVLPFDDVSMDDVLAALCRYGFIIKYTADGKEFAYIPSFKDHQVVNHREAASVIPSPVPCEMTRAPRVPTDESTRDDASRGEGKGKEGKGREHTSVCVAIAGIFGRDWEEPQNRMPALANWYRTIEEQANKLCEVYEPEDATSQVKAYLKFCEDTKRKLIGTPVKVAETILQSDWITLNNPMPLPRGSPFAEAEYNKTLWGEEAWHEYYHKQITNNPDFRKHFQITLT